jgi:uncharacterized membrane protein YhdT
MKIEEDPRIKVARRGLILSWTFYSIFLAATLAAAALSGDGPHLFGLPRWVALSCVVVPALFVAALVPIVEWLIPNIPLTDDREDAR